MAQCLLGTLIHAAPGITFNYLWNRVACDNSDKEMVGFCIQHMNLSPVPMKPWFLSATSFSLEDPQGEDHACIPHGGGSASLFSA